MHLRELDEHLDAIKELVSTLDACALTGADAAVLVRKFASGEHACAAAKAICAKRVAETGEYRATGHKDAESFLAGMTGSTRREAKDALLTADELDKLPGLNEAFRSGTLSGPQASEIASAGAVNPSSEQDLLRKAQEGSLGELREEADRVKAAARSQQEDDARHARIHANRHLRTWQDREGGFCGGFSLTPEAGATLMGRIEQIANDLFDQARQERRQESRAAYLADALVALAQDETADVEGAAGADESGRGAGAGGGICCPGGAAGGEPGRAVGECPGRGGDGAGGPSRGGGGAGAGAGDPVQSDIACAGCRGTQGPDGGPAPPPGSPPAPPPGSGGDGGATPAAPSSRRRRRGDYRILMRVDLEALLRGSLAPGEECSIDGAGHVPVSVVQSFMDVAGLRLIVTSGTDLVSVFSFSRTIPAALRTALEFRDRTCVVPGCSSTFHLEIDHKIPFADGGPTSLTNLARLCRYHHRLKTHHGYRLEGHPGEWKWIAPNQSPGSTPAGKTPRATRAGKTAAGTPADRNAGGTPSSPSPRDRRSPERPSDGPDQDPRLQHLPPYPEQQSFLN